MDCLKCFYDMKGLQACIDCKNGSSFKPKAKATEKPTPSGQAEFDWLSANCCMTCKHWADENMREKQIKAYKEIPRCMDKIHGWPHTGECANTLANGIELSINGNASATLEFDANFGCNNWERT